MRTLVTALLFLGIAAVTFAVADRFVKRWLPVSQPASQATMVVLSALLVLASVFFFTAWGLNPAVIQINLQQSLNPLRWVNWVLSALNFGVAQAFILALFRSRVERARRLGALPPPVREAGQTPAEDAAPVPALRAVGAAEPAPVPAPVGEPTRTPESANEPRGSENEQASTSGSTRPPLGFSAQDRQRTAQLAKKNLAFTRGERVAVAVLAVWVVIHIIVLGWVRTL